MEQWKDCVGWEGLYEVSNYGNVRSIQRKTKNFSGFCLRGGKQLKKILGTRGYEVVNLTCYKARKQVFVHKLVLEAFCGPAPVGFEACHNDGNRLNNSLNNLRWDTRKNNHQDKKKHGTWQVGEKANNVKFTNEVIFDIRKNKLTPTQANKKYGMSISHAKRIINGYGWPHIHA